MVTQSFSPVSHAKAPCMGLTVFGHYEAGSLFRRGAFPLRAQVDYPLNVHYSREKSEMKRICRDSSSTITSTFDVSITYDITAIPYVQFTLALIITLE